MKKFLLFVSLFIFIIGNTIGQQLFFSGFETWNSTHKPANWFGTGTNIDSNNVNKVTSGAFEGSFAVELKNETDKHKRFSTTAVSIEANTMYNVSFYAKGKGEVRTGYYKGQATSYGQYASYVKVNSATWTKITQSLLVDTTSSTAEFVLSLRNTVAADGHLQIDSFMVTKGEESSVVSIYDIQYTTASNGDSPMLGQAVSTGGVVCAVKSGSSYWLQDGTGPWSGIYVYDNVNKPAIGDKITLNAIVDEHYNLTELKSVTNYVKVSSGNAVNVNDVSISDANSEMYESVLCKLTNVNCESLPDQYKEWKVGDGMDNISVDDLIYEFTPTLNTKYDITGVMYYSFSTRKILPRSASDVVVHSAINDIDGNSFSVYPNTAENYININSNIEGIVSIYDITGKVVFSENINGFETIDVNNFEAGLYTISIIGNDGTFSSQKIMIK